jgi:cytochrome c553
MGGPVKRRGFFFAAAALAAAPAMSGPSSQVAWTLETVRLVRSGDAARGQKLHEDCAGCHGPAGNMDIPDVPDLGGQDPLYIYKQLSDYKTGSRTSSIMNDAVAALSARDMADLAAFYASQKSPSRASAARVSSAAVIKLASIGDGPRLIPACDACHGERGAGNPAFYGMPALRDQKPDDLVVQLTAFRSGERGNDVYRVMRDLSKRLTDAEIAGLAAYYGGAPPTTAPSDSTGKTQPVPAPTDNR